jgi:hypothetical protein
MSNGKQGSKDWLPMEATLPNCPLNLTIITMYYLLKNINPQLSTAFPITTVRCNLHQLGRRRRKGIEMDLHYPVRAFWSTSKYL